ncbi:MAG: hypothetical protein ACXW1R_08270 [Halobacteriota archaeon]
MKRKRRYQFCVQKYNARRIRGIPFLLTFDKWWNIWQQSGHYSERGCGSGKYCMARFGDQGAYEVGNVKIITNGENVREAHVGKTLPTKGKPWTLNRREAQDLRKSQEATP